MIAKRIYEKDKALSVLSGGVPSEYDKLRTGDVGMYVASVIGLSLIHISEPTRPY